MIVVLKLRDASRNYEKETHKLPIVRACAIARRTPKRDN
jgi:hypothetical protein